MKEIFITSDTHFQHSNILNFRDKTTGKLIRGEKFSNVDEMNEFMIDRWNSVVKNGDIVYHLGDVVIGDQEWLKTNWPRLRGSKRLIIGNHDDIKFLSSGGFFKKVAMWRKFPEFGLILTHVPLHPGTLKQGSSEDTESFAFKNLHGHIHQNASPEGPYQNVCVEVTNYTPINIEELRIR